MIKLDIKKPTGYTMHHTMWLQHTIHHTKSLVTHHTHTCIS
jgi:hypothetical protein